MFYNTTNEQGEQLKAYTEKAESQQQKILKFFKEQPAVEYGSSQLVRLIFNNQTPITSVRRSVTNLINEGKLTYSGRTRTGMYNRSERLVKLA
jgi:hypothetical protein